MGRHSAEVFLYFFVNAVGNGFDVCVRVTFADDEEICRSIEFAKVKLDDFFAFLVAYAFDDGVVEVL